MREARQRDPHRVGRGDRRATGAPDHTAATAGAAGPEAATENREAVTTGREEADDGTKAKTEETAETVHGRRGTAEEGTTRRCSS